MGKYSFAKAKDPDWDIAVMQRLKSQIKLHIFSEVLARKPRERIFERIGREINEFLAEIDNAEIRERHASELNAFADDAYDRARECIGNMSPYVFALSLADPSTLTDRQKRLVGASGGDGEQTPVSALPLLHGKEMRFLGTTKSPEYQNRIAIGAGGFGLGLSDEAAAKIADGFSKLPPTKLEGYSRTTAADTYYQNVHKRNKELIGSFAEMTVSKNYVANVNPRSWAEMNVRFEKYREDKKALISRGVKLVYVRPHSNCSKRCQPYQGRLYSLDGTRGSIDGRSYIPIEDAADNITCTSRYTGRKYYAGLFSYNCRHTMQPYERGMKFEKIPDSVIEKQRRLEMKQREMERRIRMEKEKRNLYMIAYKQSGNESVHKIATASRKKAAEMRRVYEAFSRANEMPYYHDRLKVMEGEDIYVRTKGKNDGIAKSANLNSDITSDLTEDAKRDILKLEIKNKNISIKLNHTKQAPHVYGSKEYDPKKNKSYFVVSEKELQKIINKRHATGKVMIYRSGQIKEIIELEEDIAVNMDENGENQSKTNRITIHYSKTRTHIVPTVKKGEKDGQTV